MTTDDGKELDVNPEIAFMLQFLASEDWPDVVTWLCHSSGKGAIIGHA